MGRWITKNGAHIYLPDENEVDEQEARKARQIDASKKEAVEKNTGIPATMPKKKELIERIKKMSGKEVDEAIARINSYGDWYMEDKRRKRSHLLQVTENNFKDDPAQDWDVAENMDTNRKIIEVVTGVRTTSEEFSKRFGQYDVDRLYERRPK